MRAGATGAGSWETAAAHHPRHTTAEAQMAIRTLIESLHISVLNQPLRPRRSPLLSQGEAVQLDADRRCRNRFRSVAHRNFLDGDLRGLPNAVSRIQVFSRNLP